MSILRVRSFDLKAWEQERLTLAFSHKYQQLPLISVEEFLEQFPEHDEDDESTLMMARIDHEHAERQKLEEQRQGLLKKKQALIAENNRRKVDLANLDQDLEKFIDVSVRAVNEDIFANGSIGCATYPEDLGEGILIEFRASLFFVLHSAAHCTSTSDLNRFDTSLITRDTSGTTQCLASQPRPLLSSPSRS